MILMRVDMLCPSWIIVIWRFSTVESISAYRVPENSQRHCRIIPISWRRCCRADGGGPGDTVALRSVSDGVGSRLRSGGIAELVHVGVVKKDLRQ